ncbi:glycosyltransferase family 4 protein [Aurantibacter sp.]|uniref:glycosyltransferase family 4 protein n=1 Tax=Aurantibacter sp. TaxID=2807103 RepID=UPI003263530F
MKVGFYLESKKLKSFTWEDMENNSIGLPGTTSQAFRLIYNIEKKTNWEINLFDTGTMPDYGKIKAFTVDDFNSGVESAIKNQCEVLIIIISPNHRDEDALVFKKANDANLKLIVWSHNQISEINLKLFHQLKMVKRIVGPSAIMMNWYRHKKAFSKMTFVHNALYFDYDNNSKSKLDNKQFVYIGALTEDKGFHHLAKVWPNIVKRIPKASLLVIGSSKLYNINDELGPLGITSKVFEEEYLIPYLGKDKESISKKNVSFLGLQTSIEIKKHIANSLAGVVNPNWEISPETFCVSAIEVQSMGKPIIGGNVGGLVEVSKTGETSILINNHLQLEKAILKLLNSPGQATEMGIKAKKYVLNKFDKSKITDEWIQMISNIDTKKLKKVPITKNDSTIKTVIKEALRLLNHLI